MKPMTHIKLRDYYIYAARYNRIKMHKETREWKRSMHEKAAKMAARSAAFHHKKARAEK